MHATNSVAVLTKAIMHLDARVPMVLVDQEAEMLIPKIVRPINSDHAPRTPDTSKLGRIWCVAFARIDIAATAPGNDAKVCSVTKTPSFTMVSRASPA